MCYTNISLTFRSSQQIYSENFPTKGRGGLQNLACHILQQGVGSMCQVYAEGMDLPIRESNYQRYKVKDSESQWPKYQVSVLLCHKHTITKYVNEKMK